jgi:hypothetical protein
MALTIMNTSLAIGRKYWPETVEDKEMFVFIGSFCAHTFAQITCFAFYLPGYLGWNPFLKQFHQQSLVLTVGPGRLATGPAQKHL